MKIYTYIIFGFFTGILGCQKSIQHHLKYPLDEGKKYTINIRTFLFYEFDSTNLAAEEAIVAPVYALKPTNATFFRDITFNKVQKLDVKDTINFTFRMEYTTPKSIIEPVSFYLDKKLWFQDSCLSRPHFENHYHAKGIKKELTYKLINKKKKEYIRLSIFLHNAQVYCDTIIPLKFNNVDIFYYSGEFNMRFKGMVKKTL